MADVAGADGAPGGWAVVFLQQGRFTVQKVRNLSEVFDSSSPPKILAVDIPIGLLDVYETGGRGCDREARRFLGPKRRSSVFPAPVRPVLKASSYAEACAASRVSARHGKKISKQTWAIVPKIREIDDLLRARPVLQEIVHEVHPEVCFCELAGRPMSCPKGSREGQVERRQALRQSFGNLDEIVERGRKEQRLATEDILDAVVACWSAVRLADRKGRSLVEPAPRDSAGLPMTIWA